MTAPDPPRSRGQIEADITRALIRFEREVLGRGPREARAFLLHDLVLVRLKGILSVGEQQLALQAGGVELIKQMRSRLVETFSDQLRQLVQEHTGVAVISMHTDISTKTGERVFVFGLAEDLGAR